MRKIAAHYLYANSENPMRQGVVSLNDEGIITAIDQLDDAEAESTEFYDGVLVPGFVNAHCHLELSYLQRQIPPCIGMAGFIERMMQRNPPEIQGALTAMQNANAFMYKEGVVAVGDICNNDSSFAVKKGSRIRYHSFLEVAGLAEKTGEQRLQTMLQAKKKADRLGLSASITAHAVYSANEKTLRNSAALAKQRGILSIHNQECSDENNLFLHGGGSLYRLFIQRGLNPPPSTGKTAVHSLLPLIDKDMRVLLVHNVATDEEDYEAAMQTCPHIVWVLCPKANLYIGNALPPVEMLLRKGAAIALGTDSLASNTQLSMIEEMKCLQREFPALSFKNILEWATLGGAKALNMDKELGSIAVGKRPGLVLIEHFNYDEHRLCGKSTARLLTA